MKKLIALLLVTAPALLISAPLHITNNSSTSSSYSIVAVENAVFLNVYAPANLSEVKVFWLNGRYFTKRGGLIMIIKDKNVPFDLEGLCKEKVQKFIESKTPLKLYKNDKQEYVLETLTTY